MGEEMTAYCHHFHRAVEVIARRWTPEIVRAMLAGSTRFSQIKAAIPRLSDRLLSERLKALETEGLITRSVTPDTPVRIEYALTKKGAALGNAIDAISRWAETWISEEEAEAASR